MNKAELIVTKAKQYYPETGSHGWNHIKEVIERAVALKGAPLTMLEFAAIAFHDASLKDGSRETHEIDSSEIALHELTGVFNSGDLTEVLEAIFCHRASYQGPRKTPLANLLAAADRNPPILSAMLQRSYLYAVEHGSNRGVEAAEHAIQHIREKYGKDGYAWKNCPEIYMQHYAKELKDLWEKLDVTTPKDVLHLPRVNM